MSRWHPSMGPRDCRVVCDDGTIIADELTYDEAVSLSQELDMDQDSHLMCRAHIVEMYAGWVPVATTVLS